MEFVFVKEGEFKMGALWGEREKMLKEQKAGKPQNGMPHRVTLTKPYWIGKYEVTQKEWADVMDETMKDRLYLIKKKEVEHRGLGDRKPMYCVSWNSAREYCKLLTEKELKAGRIPQGYEYRLPTEAEWECAAKGGCKGKKYLVWSGSRNRLEVAWNKENSDERTHDVGTKKANELGIYDMTGNVFEWTLDACKPKKDKNNIEVLITDTYVDGIKDPLSTVGADRLLRGGSW